MTGLRGTTRAEPDQAYDANAAEWRAKLEALSAIIQPARPASQAASQATPDYDLAKTGVQARVSSATDRDAPAENVANIYVGDRIHIRSQMEVR